MFYRKAIIFCACAAFAQVAAAQEEPLPTAADSVIAPTDSLHKEFYTVAPAVEFIPADDTPELIADRLGCITDQFPLTYNRTVQSFIDYFTIRDREYTKAMLRKKDLFFPLFEKYLAQYGLPDDLKYLSIIESGLNPSAVSRASAVGLWQFMSATGKHYGLHNNWYWDDRMDPEKSTEAACRYLAELYRIFKDWPLALAAYNSGPGTVLKANRRSGYKNDFWLIYPYLPRETKAYVPQFIAIVYAMKYADHHNLHQPHPEKPIAYDTIQVNTFLNLETFSSLTGTCKEDLKQLNPQLKAAAIPGNGKTHHLRIPVKAKDELVRNRSFIMDSASRAGRSEFEQVAKKMEEKQYLYHKVKSGSSLGQIASRYRVRVQDIRSWNNLSGNTIHPGQMLRIYVAGNSPALTASRNRTAQGVAKSGNVYVVQPGDTLWEIAKKFDGMTIEKIKLANGLTANRIEPGQRLVIR